ncbi:MAG TPA: hypothetical protein VHB73_07225, partial [Alphaproteobacteria bacterium]|nr:hypothetical protein [Alphaproteobacteria bacterium]
MPLSTVLRHTKRFSRRWFFARGLFAFAFALLFFSSPALAQNVSTSTDDEKNRICVIAGSTSQDIQACAGAVIFCPTGRTSCPNYRGVQIAAGQTAPIPIDAWDFCRYLTNVSNNSFFVPFNTDVEWGASAGNTNGFLNNLPQGVTANTCARPGNVEIPADYPKWPPGDASAADNPFYDGDARYTCDHADKATSAVLPYAPTGSSYVSTAKAFTCTVKGLCDEFEPTICGEDQTWQEIATPTMTAGRALDNSDRPADGAWTLTAVVYSGTKPDPKPVPPIDGTCGAASGVSASSAPASDLCGAHDTPSAVVANSDGSWSWSCAGRHGGQTVSCSAQHSAEDGECGAAALTTFDSAPAEGLCAKGDSSVVSGSDDGPWSWTCTGKFSGSAVTCTAKHTAKNGQCGPSSNWQTSGPPTGGFCSTGSMADFTTAPDGSFWSWTCKALGDGTDDICWSAVKKDGGCGPSHEHYMSSAPTSGFCADGSTMSAFATAPDGSFWSWSCIGTGDGAIPTCWAAKSVDGACGSAYQQYLPSAPTSGFCTDDSKMSAFTTAPDGSFWSWTCNGVGTGASPTCWAAKSANGACGSSGSQYLTSAPTSGFCADGSTMSGFTTGPTSWSWTCEGLGGGASEICWAAKKEDGACGSANGTSITSAPSSGLCTSGTPSGISGSGPWSWTCAGTNGGNNATCSASNAYSCTAGSYAAVLNGYNEGSETTFNICGGIVFNGFNATAGTISDPLSGGAGWNAMCGTGGG